MALRTGRLLSAARSAPRFAAAPPLHAAAAAATRAAPLLGACGAGVRHQSEAATFGEQGICPFSILRIDPTVELGDIKRAYFEAAARCHPDVMPASALCRADPEAVAKEFHSITAAYQALMDPTHRRTMVERHQQRSPQPPSRPAAPATADRRDFDDGMTWRRQQQEMEWCARASLFRPTCGAPGSSRSLALART